MASKKLVKSGEGGSEGETLFLKYAYPCTFIIKMRGQVDLGTVKKLEDAAITGKSVSRAVLERVYKKAFVRLRKVASSLKERDCLSERVVREYFLRRHSSMIADDPDYKNAPRELRKLCRVEIAKVVEKTRDFLVVQYSTPRGKRETRTVSSAFVPTARVGDKVSIHYGYAVEILG